MNKLLSRYFPVILRTVTKMTGVDKPVENSIKVKLENGLKPSFLEIFNESYMHNVPEGSETHFKVVVVSEQFTDQPPIKRHRMVNELLQHELKNGVHALSIVAKTPGQWEQSSQTVSPSPKCRGGFGK
ncbi:bolA-like protein DDB_G0274169 [Fopius arisanus]|uniref:BolA-like protein DDB_G0274169 n=1 Tax=Fopius arisanus TaxID=64838 RepID=A0A9R1TMD2_9HYME|nr:PREDICTED: bolA-like protein DDB_G0274169 [Fopius arisanus]